jgi:hypothetical protein
MVPIRLGGGFCLYSIYVSREVLVPRPFHLNGSHLGRSITESKAQNHDERFIGTKPVNPKIGSISASA